MTTDRRHQSQADRDLASERARKDRDAAPDRAWHEEATGVHTDTQVFRALKGMRDELRDELHASKTEAARAHGALKAEVLQLATKVERQDAKLDAVTTTTARMEGKLDVMLADRRPAGTSSQQRTVSVVEKLATAVIDDKLDGERHRRERVTAVWRSIWALVSSPAVAVAIGAAVTLLLHKLRVL